MVREVPQHHDQDPTLPHKPDALRKLESKWNQNTLVCVGLDTEYGRLPSSYNNSKITEGMYSFNRDIIDATSDLVCAYKPNLAFYESEAADGLEALEDTVGHIRELDPEIAIIIDGKRADIGNTNRGYARFLFDRLDADAITTSPYLGSSFIKDGERKLESLAPFLNEKDKLVFVLCRTSNPDAGEFQDLPIALKDLPAEYKAKFGDLTDLADKIESNVAPLYLVMAHKLARDWNQNGNVGLVVGATYPAEMAQIRKVVGDMPILMPGIGAQEAEARAAVRAGINSERTGIVVNASRSIIYASSGDNYDEAARAATQILKNQVNSYRAS